MINLANMAVVLNHSYLEDYSRKYSKVIDDTVKGFVDDLISFHKSIMVDQDITEEEMVRYDPNNTDRCLVCDLVVSDIGERMIHVLDHVGGNIENEKFDNVVSVLKYLVVYGEYMNGVMNNIGVEDMTDVVLKMFALSKDIKSTEVEEFGV